VSLGQVAIDGTKIKANASKHAAMSYRRMVEEEQRLRAQIAQYFSESEAADREEDEAPRSEWPKGLRTAEKRLAVIESAKRALEEEAKEKARFEQAERRREAREQGRTFRARKTPEGARPTPRAQRNFTDPDSRIMKNSDKAFVQAYNAQAAVDVESQIIVAARLTNQAADAPHLTSLVEDVNRHCGRNPDEVLADAGYWSEANISKLEEKRISVLIPPEKIRHRTWQEGIPTAGPTPGADASLAERMRHRLNQPEERARYRKRECSVEPVYGQIKEGRGLRQFLLRGLHKVQPLWWLDCAAHNLLKLYRNERRTSCPQPT